MPRRSVFPFNRGPALPDKATCNLSQLVLFGVSRFSGFALFLRTTSPHPSLLYFPSVTPFFPTRFFSSTILPFYFARARSTNHEITESWTGCGPVFHGPKFIIDVHYRARHLRIVSLNHPRWFIQRRGCRFREFWFTRTTTHESIRTLNVANFDERVTRTNTKLCKILFK